MEFQNGQAIYLQIVDYICENILSGKWKTGDRAPSVRDLAVSVEVNPNTVMRAYTYLQDKEIIQNQRGIGYYITENSFDYAMTLKRDEFIGTELPKVFRMIDLLKINKDEFFKLYQNYKNKEEKKR